MSDAVDEWVKFIILQSYSHRFPDKEGLPSSQAVTMELAASRGAKLSSLAGNLLRLRDGLSEQPRRGQGLRGWGEKMADLQVPP